MTDQRPLAVVMVADPTPLTLTNLRQLSRWCDLLLTEGTETISGQPRRPLPFMQRLLGGPLKSVVANGARKQVAKKARPEHYPAPYAIIDLWEKHDGNALAAPEIIDRIITSPTARNLVRVYHLQERLKSFGKSSDFKAKRVHVIGAGVMGGDIAAWCALRGMTVTLPPGLSIRSTRAFTSSSSRASRMSRAVDSPPTVPAEI